MVPPAGIDREYFAAVFRADQVSRDNIAYLSRMPGSADNGYGFRIEQSGNVLMKGHGALDGKG